MAPTRRAVLGTATALGLAGCLGGGDGDTPTDEPSPTATDGDSSSPDDDSATVQARSHDDHGEILVGPEGQTLYVFDQDTRGEGASTCYDDCASNWPPLTVDGEPTTGESVTADLTTFEREDGSAQVAADGWPLYYFAADESPGDTNGQGVGEVWWVLRPDGTPVRRGADAASPTATATPTPTDPPDGDDGGDGGGGGGGYEY